MDVLFEHMAGCCSPQRPAGTINDTTVGGLVCCMEQLSVGSSAKDSSCRSPALRSPRLRTTTAATTAADAVDTASAGLPKYRIFTFDIETTGFSTTNDAIIEMAVVDVASSNSWSSLVRPEPYKQSSRAAYNAHGISHYDLLKPTVPTAAAALQALSAFITKHTTQQQGAVPLLVAHNGFAFDFKALAIAVLRQQQQQQPGVGGSFNSGSTCVYMPQHMTVFDTLVLARRLTLGKQLGLKNQQQATIREHFLGAPPAVVHRALADSQELAALLPHLLQWAAVNSDQGLDEKLLPRSFARFLADAAAVGVDACGSSTEAASKDAGVLADGASEVDSTSSSRRGSRKTRKPSTSSSRGRGRGRGKKLGTAVGASGTPGTHQQQQEDVSSIGWAGASVSLATAVASAAATALELSSDEECSAAEVGCSKTVTACVTAVAASAVGAVTVQKTEGHSQPLITSSSSSSHTDGSTATNFTLYQQSQSSSSHPGQPSASSSSSNSISTAPTVQPARAVAAAAAEGSVPAGAADTCFVNVRGQPVSVMSSSAFLHTVQASLNSGSSSGSSVGVLPGLLQLGRFTPGRSDPSSGFSEVLLGPEGLPVVFLLEGLVISKDIKISRSYGRLQPASLFVKAATRQRAQQQHIKQVGASVNSITQLLPGLQQQQRQEVFSCLSGTSLQVRLPVKPGAPYLDMTIRRLSQESSSDPSSSSCSSRRLVPVATPNLAAVDAADRLQQLLPVSSAVSVVLWPSCVWSNSRFRGVTLNCVEVWLH